MSGNEKTTICKAMPERVIVENEELLIAVAYHGAELCRIYDKKRQREVLWDADPEYWGRFAPVLFPMVGASYQGVYRYQGSTYQMGQHGFARDSEFQLVSKKDTVLGVSFELKANEKTLEQYPFSFRLEIEYRLIGRSIEVLWRVTNEGKDVMYYNIGAHPAFRVPEGLQMTDMAFGFEMGQKPEYIRIEDPGSGCAFTEKKYVLQTEGTENQVAVTADFWNEGVYIFEDGQIGQLQLLAAGQPYVTILCQGFPYFGIWSKPQYPFICMEPWQGRCDNIGYTGSLPEKTGIMKLASQETQAFQYSIRIE